MTEEHAWLPADQNIKDYKLLKDMLHSQKKEFDLLSKKKADEQLNPMKIKIANRVLEPLKELFKHEESHKFLDTLNEDEMPTNSDVVLIISQYETAVNEFRSKYYLKDKYQSNDYSTTTRWMTEEYPPDYYANEENGEDYDEDEE
jgi:hypothetical protein